MEYQEKKNKERKTETDKNVKELFQVSQACAVNKFPGHAIGHSIENYIHLPKNEMKYLIIQTRKREREREKRLTNTISRLQKEKATKKISKY